MQAKGYKNGYAALTNQLSGLAIYVYNIYIVDIYTLSLSQTYMMGQEIFFWNIYRNILKDVLEKL